MAVDEVTENPSLKPGTKPRPCEKYIDNFFRCCDVEFKTTNSMLGKLKECKSNSEMEAKLKDYNAIKEEIVNVGMHECNFLIEKEFHDNMSYRISDRLRDFCFEEKLTDEYIFKVKEIYSAEDKAGADVFFETCNKEGNLERKKVIDDMALIKSNLRKHEQCTHIKLSEEKLNNAAKRVQRLLCDLCLLTLRPAKDLPLKPDDGKPPC
ncbi:gamete antigen 27/25, putative [Plasmodium gallinaceum]|uniref:Gamete antigen 27/25, putative n=1 Tax=Plasmodium gallinaceum TaxID=5849 RepID=A0A1J1GSJ1_PLAGA|nr:gamete antigen 27/25, putative [Plasmodium gallinaceum]CRG95449.1 gamete antigen 27/25, putative [Plasmodium gallinaceum]